MSFMLPNWLHQSKPNNANVKLVVTSKACGHWIHSICHLIGSLLTKVRLPLNTHTHTHPFNGPLSRTTRVSRYQKGKPVWILLKQEMASGSGISWAVCKSAPCSLPPNQQRQSTEGTEHWRYWRLPLKWCLCIATCTKFQCCSDDVCFVIVLLSRCSVWCKRKWFFIDWWRWSFQRGATAVKGK